MVGPVMRFPPKLPRMVAPQTWLVCLALLGCDSGKKGDDKKEPSFSKAFDNSSAQVDPKAADKGLKDLREKADREHAEARKAELEQITNVTPPLPADVATACTAAGEAMDEFKQKRLAGDAVELERWNRTKEPDVRKFVEACTAMGKVEIGACLTDSHRNASLAMFGADATDDFAARCQERWGDGAAAPSTP